MAERAGVRILVDTREKTPWKFTEAATVERVNLPTGDYSLAGFTDRVAIERKSLPDLVMCVGPERERFMDEMRRLRAYDVRAVVVEAAIDDVLAHAYRSNTAPQSVIGTTVAIWSDYNVTTLWAGDARNAANLVERLFVRIAAKGLRGAA